MKIGCGIKFHYKLQFSLKEPKISQIDKINAANISALY